MQAPVIEPIDGYHPQVPDRAFVAGSAHLLGRVRLEEDASVWYTAVLRGDQEHITVGARTNIQDGCVLHADSGLPATLGADVTVGHRAVVHGCTVEDGCLIGMGAVLLNGCRIGAGSLVAAGTVVLEGTEVPPGSLVVGSPGKVRRELSAEERGVLAASAEHYVALAGKHRDSPQ